MSWASSAACLAQSIRSDMRALLGTTAPDTPVEFGLFGIRLELADKSIEVTNRLVPALEDGPFGHPVNAAPASCPATSPPTSPSRA